jgi:hypothetical protein
MGPEARGTAFLGILKHVRIAFGADALEAAVARAPAETRDVLSRRVLKLRWYPYEAYAGFLRMVVESFASGNDAYCRELGTVAAHRDLKTVFKLFRALYGPQRLIRSCTRVWIHYYRNAGTMTALSAEPHDTRLRIDGFAAMDPAHCRLMEGWMIGAMQVIGAEVDDNARETLCNSRGDACHEFACTWTLARRPT